MDTPQTPNSAETVSGRLLGLIAPGRHRAGDDRPRRKVEDREYLEMMWRMVRGLEARAINDPVNLPQVVALTQRLAEVVNVAIAANAERYAIDPHAGASMAECARSLGISKQSASERRARGVEIMTVRLAAAGVARFSEARRERQAVQAAHEYAVVNLADWQARHAAA